MGSRNDGAVSIDADVAVVPHGAIGVGVENLSTSLFCGSAAIELCRCDRGMAFHSAKGIL